MGTQWQQVIGAELPGLFPPFGVRAAPYSDTPSWFVTGGLAGKPETVRADDPLRPDEVAIAGRDFLRKWTMVGRCLPEMGKELPSNDGLPPEFRVCETIRKVIDWLFDQVAGRPSGWLILYR